MTTNLTLTVSVPLTGDAWKDQEIRNAYYQPFSDLRSAIGEIIQGAGDNLPEPTITLTDVVVRAPRGSKSLAKEPRRKRGAKETPEQIAAANVAALSSQSIRPDVASGQVAGDTTPDIPPRLRRTVGD